MKTPVFVCISVGITFTMVGSFIGYSIAWATPYVCGGV